MTTMQGRMTISAKRQSVSDVESQFGMLLPRHDVMRVQPFRGATRLTDVPVSGEDCFTPDTCLSGRTPRGAAVIVLPRTTAFGRAELVDSSCATRPRVAFGFQDFVSALLKRLTALFANEGTGHYGTVPAPGDNRATHRTILSFHRVGRNPAERSAANLTRNLNLRDILTGHLRFLSRTEVAAPEGVSAPLRFWLAYANYTRLAVHHGR